MRVAVQRALGVAVLRLIAGQVPDDQGLVSATGQEHVGAVEEHVRLRSRFKGATGGVEWWS